MIDDDLYIIGDNYPYIRLSHTPHVTHTHTHSQTHTNTHTHTHTLDTATVFNRSQYTPK